jgi:hypothetical protein
MARLPYIFCVPYINLGLIVFTRVRVRHKF